MIGTQGVGPAVAGLGFAAADVAAGRTETTVDGRAVAVGGPRLVADMGLEPDPAAEAWGRDGRAVLHVVADGRILGASRSSRAVAACGSAGSSPASVLTGSSPSTEPSSAATTAPASVAPSTALSSPGVGGLPGEPDASLTPGATNPVVTQTTIGSTICVSGWTATGHARAVRLAAIEGRASSPRTNAEGAGPARLDEVPDENTSARRERLVDDAHEAAREVGRRLIDALGEDLVALYLHGSAVLGGFRWERSDLDLLALSGSVLSDQQFERVVGALVPLRYPANGLEFTLMTADDASRPALSAPRFQLHLTTGGSNAVRKVVDGRPREGDRDLVLHLAVCREHGEAIVGPPARSLLGALPNEAVEAAMRDEIGWARQHGPPEYLVLISARAWLFFASHRIASKIEAGVWAAAHDAEPAVIEAALARQRGTPVAIPTDAAKRFADRVEHLIRRPQAGTAGDHISLDR